MFKKEYKYYKIVESCIINNVLYREFDIIRLGGGTNLKEYTYITIIYSLNEERINSKFKINLKEIQKHKEFVKDKLILINEHSKQVTKTDLKIVNVDKRELYEIRLDYEDNIKAYKKATKLMLESIKFKKNKETKFYCYSDVFRDGLNIWSDCGLCSNYKLLNKNKEDIKTYLCPFNSNKENIHLNNPNFNCYKYCLLKNGLEEKECIELINNRLNDVLNNTKE